MQTLYNNSSDILSFTDINDATVLATTITRGDNAINVDGTKATTSDKIMAVAGAVIPVISGSGVKQGIEFIGERAIGAYKSLQGKFKEAHHIIQDKAVDGINGYKKANAPAIHLEGSASNKSTPHGKTRQVQKDINSGGGTYGSERRVSYRALRVAGLSIQDAKAAVKKADEFFEKLGITLNTPTSTPKDRK